MLNNWKFVFWLNRQNAFNFNHLSFYLLIVLQLKNYLMDMKFA